MLLEAGWVLNLVRAVEVYTALKCAPMGALKT